RSHRHEGGRERSPALHSLGAILSWFIEAKTRCDWSARPIPLADVAHWSRTADEIVDAEQRRFRIVAVRVKAGNREVMQWTQPLLEPRGQGLVVFVARQINGV